jgi:hypothetical protein
MTAQDPSEQPDVEVLRRLRSLDELLPALSGALDVRDVFARISEIAQKVLPHDMLALPLASEDRQTVVVYASPARCGLRLVRPLDDVLRTSAVILQDGLQRD